MYINFENKAGQMETSPKILSRNPSKGTPTGVVPLGRKSTTQMDFESEMRCGVSRAASRDSNRGMELSVANSRVTSPSGTFGSSGRRDLDRSGRSFSPLRMQSSSPTNFMYSSSATSEVSRVSNSTWPSLIPGDNSNDPTMF